MHNRIRQLREKLGLTQPQFAETLGLKFTTISCWETGSRTPSEVALRSICREFNVNEEWLKNGTGEMFINIPRNDEIAEYVGKILEGEPSIQTFLLELMMETPESLWVELEKYGKIILEKRQKKDG